jgi:cytoskeletal protein CcmA (bactofilin family)
MWKRDEAVRPTSGGPASAGGVAPAAASSESGPRLSEARRPLEKEVVNIGKSVIIKGELSGSEDLTVEGQVEGKIELRQNVLTIGPHGKIRAQVFAKAVVVLGEVVGNITATEKVDIREHGSVEGDLVAPRVAIAEGAHFRGSIDMQRGPAGAPRPAATAAATPAAAEPRAAPAPPEPAPAGSAGGAR